MSAATAREAEVRTAVRVYRSASASLRDILRNGGRTAATAQAVNRHEARRAAAVVVLDIHGERSLIGWLVEEAALAKRLQAARAEGLKRPELEARLNQLRRGIRARLSENPAGKG